MIAYTRARRYELMTFKADSNEYVSFAPQRIFLEPSQQVEVLQFPSWPSIKELNPANVSTLIPVRATVQGHAVDGWLPKYSLTQNYLRQHVPAPEQLQGDRKDAYSITFTGVKYGAYGTGAPDHDESKAPLTAGVVPPVQALWKSVAQCPHCAKPRGDHKIHETTEASAECEELHALILQKAGAVQQGARTMIGVLHVVDTLSHTRRGYVAMSSPTHLYQSAQANKIGQELRAQIDACVEFANAKGYTFAPKLITPFKNCSGSNSNVQPDIKTTTCAAAKLLSHAINDCFPQTLQPDQRDAIRLFLSEKWCRTDNYGNKGADISAHQDRHTIDSCNKCRGYVPSMLCFYENPYKKSLVGRV